MVSLPIKNNGYIDFDFMESFIAELEAERVAELSAYLTVSGLDNYELSSDEENALKNYQSLKWDTYNLEKLFGKSTRGKRLKGDDRIAGTLPFVTAGEASEGISAYISNEVEVFEKNTTTIDMFGSAKYRNYIYGGDDHIAVVHTENLPKYASIFVTTAIHKSSHNGQFDYGHNFYAKDADVLYISLPVNEAGNPDYDKMAIIISAIHILRAVLCRMAAEAVPQVLLCVAGTEILQTGEQCLLSDLRRTCDARYLFLSFNHASLIEYCCAGNRCRGECCKYAGGSFVWHTAGIQSDLHIVGLDQLAKRIEKRL